MRMRSTARELIETLALIVFVVAFLQSTLQNYRVDGPSMEPFLVHQDRILVNKVEYLQIDSGALIKYLPWIGIAGTQRWTPIDTPQRGDVVVFRFPEDQDIHLVKRIIGEPGDVVEIVHGSVLVNGSELDEIYLSDIHYIDEMMAPVEVEPDNYFVMGDNRYYSRDSRYWGTVPSENIIGSVWVHYWAPNTLDGIVGWLW